MTGDPNRSIFRSWTSVNRSKRCVTIDVKTPEGLKIAQQLCVAADVVTSNFRPGCLSEARDRCAHAAEPEAEPDRARERSLWNDRAARGRRRLRHVLPGAVRTRLARRRDWQSAALESHVDGRFRGRADRCSWRAAAPVSARADRRWRGARCGVAANAGLYLLSELVQRPDGKFEGAPPVNAQQTGYHPAEQLYEAADGWVAIAARGDRMARSLLEVLRLGESISTPRSSWSDDAAAAISKAVRGWR